ncbi:MAG: hypothetical protein IJ011_04175 [Clostridia bacterium]|nr:hypothetical protein [Clostridia bacterium]
MEAKVLLVKCPTKRETFGVRIQKMDDGDWWRTWAFKLNTAQAQNEGYDETQVQGNLNETEEYPGCPHCGTHGFVQCGKCKKISCWKHETSMVCPWCGNNMSNIVTATSKFDVTGGAF